MQEQDTTTAYGMEVTDLWSKARGKTLVFLTPNPTVAAHHDDCEPLRWSVVEAVL